MRTVIRIGVTLGLIAIGAFAALTRGADASVEIRPDVLVHGATAEQVHLARWAVRRFEAARLQMPPVEILSHGAPPDGCVAVDALVIARTP
jgi:hypothetical protein